MTASGALQQNFLGSPCRGPCSRAGSARSSAASSAANVCVGFPSGVRSRAAATARAPCCTAHQAARSRVHSSLQQLPAVDAAEWQHVYAATLQPDVEGLPASRRLLAPPHQVQTVDMP
jgi:hypothetical protein